MVRAVTENGVLFAPFEKGTRKRDGGIVARIYAVIMERRSVLLTSPRVICACAFALRVSATQPII